MAMLNTSFPGANQTVSNGMGPQVELQEVFVHQ